MVVQTQEKLLTGEELAYIAGFFDGEGSVHIAFNGARSGLLRVHLSSTDRSAVEYLKDTFGGSITDYSAKGNHKPISRWSLVSGSAADFLYDLLPYLKLKKKHAMLGIDWQATVRNRGGKGYSDSELEWRSDLHEMLRELNVRGNGKSNDD